jgi:Fe-S cluster assembly protein SufD
MKSPALEFDALAAAVNALPEDALSAARQSALQQLRKSGMPGVREEDWKYTDVSALVDITNAWLTGGASLPREAAAPQPPASIDADWITIANGQVDDSLIGQLPDGVTVSRLSAAGSELASLGRLGDFNTALLHDGLKICVNEGASLKRPIGLFIADHAADGANVSQVRIEIEVARLGSASFIEYQVSGGHGDLYANVAVDLTLADGASADYVRIQDRGAQHNQTGYHGIELGRDARLRKASFDVGGKLVRNDLVVGISQPGAEAEFGGLYLVGDRQHVDNHTRVDHRVGPAVSRQEYRGILAGKARGVWNGKAIVHEGADGTDAEQSNHNLLLSQNAEINAKPELEIYADDVKCSHGTTVGQLDETALFYLRTRGLDRSEARQFLTRAFALTIVGRSPIEQIEDYLLEQIDRRLKALLEEADK